MELTPTFDIRFNSGENVIRDRVIDISTNDAAGFESDSCEITLDDYDGALTMPRTEALMTVSLGYIETGLVNIGTYYVKEILIDGAQKVIRIKGNATSKAMRSMKTRTNSGTLSEIFSSMVLDAKLTSAFDEMFAPLVLDDMLQIAESDISYLTRIAKKTGAVTKPVAGHLIFANSMQAKSVSGKNLPTKYIDATEITNYTCAFRETETTTEGSTSGTVFANWFDKETGEYHLISSGSGEPETELKEIFSDEQSARTAITSQAKTITKNNTTLRFSTAGRPDLFAESPLVLRGFPEKVPTNWIISNVQHSFSGRGFTTSVECNIRS